MNKEIQKIKPSGIFTNYIFKTIPLAFDESMSYYETLCGILSLLKTQEEVVNNNADLLAELESYVQNYFKNLDIQTEINNKLDAMATDGTLENLIGEYIQLKTTYVYDNVELMKNSTNLVNGSYARTSGFYNYNDDGGAYYKIRNITNSDIVNEMSIIALNDSNLIAELIKNNVNVKQYGAKGDDINDDTLAIQKCIDENIVVNIPKGIYKITNSINIFNSNQKIYGEGNTLSVFKKYGSTSFNESINYNNEAFNFNDYPSIINLIFPENNNISNVEIKDIQLYSNTNNGNNGIIAPHISYSNFYRVRTNNMIRGFKIGGWINKIDNCDILSNNDNGIEIVDGIYTVIEKTHTNNITTSKSKGVYITNCAVDNGYPCFRILNSQSVFIQNCSTETNRLILLNQNSYVYSNGCDFETHSSEDLNYLQGFFQGSQNGETHIENSYIHYDDYYNYGNPNNKSLVYLDTGKIKINDCKLNINYDYTLSYSSNGGTIEFNDQVKSSVNTTTKKTGRFSKTDGLSVEVLRLPFTYNKNYMLNIKSWASFTYHEAIKIDAQMVACANGDNSGLSPDVNYIVAKPSTSSFNSYLHLEKENDELVLYYKSTNAYDNQVYFEIEYTNS